MQRHLSFIKLMVSFNTLLMPQRMWLNVLPQLTHLNSTMSYGHLHNELGFLSSAFAVTLKIYELGN